MSKQVEYKLQDTICNKCSNCKVYQVLKCEGVDNDRPFYCGDYTPAYKEDNK